MRRREDVHILVVEDDEEYRKVVLRILQIAGFHVVTADGFASAMAVIESDAPVDLLLSDLGMPAGTPHGLSIAKMAQLRRRDLRVIFMTGGDAQQFALLNEGDTVLAKPFTTGALIGAIEAALGLGIATEAGRSRRDTA